MEKLIKPPAIHFENYIVVSTVKAANELHCASSIVAAVSPDTQTLIQLCVVTLRDYRKRGKIETFCNYSLMQAQASVVSNRGAEIELHVTGFLIENRR